MISLKSNNWVLNDIDTILFDKDGTFIDLHYFWGKITEMRVSKIISCYNLDNESFESLCLFLGYDSNKKKMLSDGITALYSRSKIIELFLEELKNYNLELSIPTLENIFDNITKEFNKNLVKYVKPIDEAIEFIKTIKKLGLKTGVVTADSLVSTNLIIKSFGWENLFDVVIGRESTIETKESGIPVKIAVEQLKADFKSVAMIGDTPTDLIAAKNAGIDKTVLVATGQVKFEDLLKNTSFVVNSLSEIKTLC